jgi:hypothetical protein
VNPAQLLHRGLVPFAVLVLLHAAVQALLVGLDPRQPFDTVSLLMAALSGVVLLAGVVLLWSIAERSARLSRPAGPLVLRTLVAGLAAAVTAVLLPPLLPLVLVAGCAVLAAGGVVPAGSMAARHPVRFAVLAIVTLLIVLLGWVADLLLGLFVTGVPAAAVSWMVVGAAAVLLACQWQALASRPARARA